MRSESSDSITFRLTAPDLVSPSLSPSHPISISFINATKHLSVAEHQEQDGRQAHRRLVRARRRSQDKEAGHQVSARLFCTEWSGESLFALGYSQKMNGNIFL